MQLYANKIYAHDDQTPRNDFGFLDWNTYFHKGCNYSNEANEIM